MTDAAIIASFLTHVRDGEGPSAAETAVIAEVLAERAGSSRDATRFSAYQARVAELRDALRAELREVERQHEQVLEQVRDLVADEWLDGAELEWVDGHIAAAEAREGAAARRLSLGAARQARGDRGIARGRPPAPAAVRHAARPRRAPARARDEHEATGSRASS